jgi:hypothetical protein
MVPDTRISPNVELGRSEMEKWAKLIRAANIKAQ